MQEALEESVQMMKEAVDDLGATLSEAASAAGAVGGMVDSINDAINKMEDAPTHEPEGTFVDYQTTMVKTAKAIAVNVQEMVRLYIVITACLMSFGLSCTQQSSFSLKFRCSFTFIIITACNERVL